MSPGVPKETAWRPYITFLITFIDVKNAMNVIPGQFVANGHDYRASLVRFTSLAYDLPAADETIAELNEVLAARELKWGAVVGGHGVAASAGPCGSMAG